MPCFVFQCQPSDLGNRMLPFLPFCLQEYTTKLAALQGKGDDYEAAAAQVRPSSFECCVS